MTFWVFVSIFVAIVTMVVLYAVSSPLRKGQERSVVDSLSSDIEIYKNQLSEVDADLQRDLIDKESAEEVRLELSRNILAAEKQKKQADFINKRSRGLKTVITVAIFCVPLITLGCYLFLGSPGLESHPFNDLMIKDPSNLTAEERLVRTEALFARNPDNGKLADELATGYLVEGRFQDAVNTYVSALRLNGESAPRLVGYGMALAGYNGGTINEDAKESFQKAAKLAPDDFYPRLFIAESLRQDGKFDDAIAELKNYLSGPVKDNVARKRVEETIKELEKAKADSTSPKNSTENGKTTAPAENGSVGEQDEINNGIYAMVGKLAQRLEQNPDNLEGWKQLIHSWLVLKETEKARNALKEGQSKLTKDKALELETYAKEQGLALE
ncbi:c-type cytochrome biogenesis protein CcmI [Bartonella apihabitans]|uniref:c-type cytochrome biogenesis protein CcmI n=1 Tax=uncultured Bartonella sp. TaxID=104108 RepID=UPI0025F4F5FB|nr:c-type cytochrome biogenesis protein CcmI [Bartonella apihabitans]WLT09154.1 c-type cytochrome biogenesis protein CcmI [Bartonella apihabitans]